MSPRLAATLTAVAILALIACSGPQHPPDPQNVPEADAEEIVREYIFNRERAKEAHEDKWFTITAGPVTKIGYGNRAIVKYKGTGTTLTVLIFNEKDQAAQINRGQHVRAVCQFQGLVALNTIYKFDKCRWPDGPPTN